jgi:ABC-type dipeptide/oligopeptide/nickel transport system permease subunit
MTATVTDPVIPAPPSRLRLIGRGFVMFFRRAPLSGFWGVVAALIVAMAVAAPVIAPYPPLKSDFRAMQKPPSEAHWFGTDQIGRDTLSRVIYGAQTSLTVALGAVLFGTTVGVYGAWPAAISADASTWRVSVSSNSCNPFPT